MEFSLTWADLLSIFVGYIVVRWLTKSVKITYTYNDDDIEDVKEEIFEAVDAKHIRMRIERECGTLLAYDVNTNSFVAQGHTWDELSENFQHRYPTQVGWIMPERDGDPHRVIPNFK